VIERIEKAFERIAENPYIGRAGGVEDTREHKIADSPFTVLYQVSENTIDVFSVFHESRDPGRKYE